MKKKIYILLGSLFFSMGLIGYYLPVLPGTIFMIIAAYFFMHSSERLYQKIISNPYYGNPIKQYIEKHIISMKAKVLILSSMWIATIITIYITPPLVIPFFYDTFLNLKIIGIILSFIGTIVVLRARNR
ncbi:MAG: hypothetical protein CBD21_03800 [bacterium TMED161]|nr:MAG: hypothetical protein CBD21_03800 [bacterium TMED161]|tara:strand:- start:3025 stop:3411 length:387 start_codon:yes stop_codon:yes gene_type:complete